ncbi:unnamed protein product [marine sediment metagenome]|uniref:Type II/III secretion system secretin-like domain-containing protein n=1 Tax=marine sediment metagenome TaxID=412755 RepID=X1HGX3_9ZZZZ
MKCAIASLLVGALLAGCAAPGATRFEHQDLRLEVRAKLLPAELSRRARLMRAYGIMAFSDVTPRQVLIEARFLSAARDQSLMGIDLVTDSDLLRPVRLENTTPKAPPITVGFGFGGSFGGGNGLGQGSHGPDDTSEHGSAARGAHGEKVSMGFAFPLYTGKADRVTSARATFHLPQVNLLEGCHVLLTWMGKSATGEIIVQPVLLPLTLTLTPKPEPGPTRVETIVHEGETVILAGLLGSTPANKVPVLGKLPIIGRLFDSRLDTVRRSELLVFLTPQIVVQDD